MKNKEDLIHANHILHYHNVVDAFGHISLRHPDKPDVYIMSASKAPALVSTASDLIQYHVSDSSPVDPNAKKGYQERFIHSEIYKRFPDINCVIHSHAQAVIPYTMNGVELRPIYHMAGFLGDQVPVFDITELYKPGESQDFLVNSERFGYGLAEKFSKPGSTSQDCSVVLMANHGFTTLGSSIRQAVYRAVYTHVNAGLQTNAIMLRNAAGSSSIKGPLRFLNAEQASGSERMNDAASERPWQLWIEEVEACPLYQNEALKTDASEDV
ncbi:class II aldolase and Adducin N-terminal domain-domain-containing protein [Rutstroemia sp. NJR-2017a WRK4]|nr:class II aldolase and Adducin N-terminal domain-domain-containing protein [Rutstroemia sp. NJR-2017a WRK4]